MKCSICGSKDERTISKITDKHGSKYYCIECRVTHSCLEKFNFKNNSKFIDDITGEKGAVKFEWLNETYVLEKERMLRLLSHELKPEEYFFLAKKYGTDKFMISDAFYDRISGIAIHPYNIHIAKL